MNIKKKIAIELKITYEIVSLHYLYLLRLDYRK